jgi:hypothetical protein
MGSGLTRLPFKLGGTIYLHRIDDPRMEGSALRNLLMFRKLCGKEFVKNIIPGTTFWGVVGEEEGAAREEELLQTDGFFKDMKEHGCDVVRIADDRDSNLELLSRFAAKRPIVIRIQQEPAEPEKKDEERLAQLREEKSRQDQRFEGQLNGLNEQLRKLRGGVNLVAQPPSTLLQKADTVNIQETDQQGQIESASEDITFTLAPC